MAVAAQHDHAGTNQPEFRRDDVLDALQRIVRREKPDAGSLAVAREVLRLQQRRRIANHARRFRVRRNDVAHDGELLLADAAPRGRARRVR